MLATSRMGLTPLVCCAVLLSVSACGESHTDKSATGRTPPGRTTVRTPPTRATTPDSGLPAGIVAKAGGNSIDEQTLEHWKADTDLAGLRDAAPLAKLPEDEQKVCRAIWAEVDALLAKARAGTAK